MLRTVRRIDNEAVRRYFPAFSLDAEYRLTRKKLMHLVMRQPALMSPIIKTLDQGWKYMHKLFAPYNL